MKKVVMSIMVAFILMLGGNAVADSYTEGSAVNFQEQSQQLVNFD
jgi:hypothetical protein